MLGGIGFTGSQSAEIKSRTTQIETRRENYKEYKKYDENKTIQMLYLKYRENEIKEQ